jgi:hypothetical protein
MVIDNKIKQIICEKIGLAMDRNAHFVSLSDDIFRITKERLSVNTLKRLFGQIKDVETSKSTLSIIAHYLGYPSWEVLNKGLKSNNSQFSNSTKSIHPKKMKVGTSFSLTYYPNRTLILEVINGNYCKVLSVSGGKLEQTDLLDISSITLGVPFVVEDVVRDGQSAGRFVGGIEGGVIDIHILES